MCHLPDATAEEQAAVLMGEQLTYRCVRCGTMFQGMNRGYFVTGIVDGTFCSIRCLAIWAEAYIESVERAMAHIDYGVAG